MRENKLALISVSNKEGIVPFAHALQEIGFQIVATGKTAQELSNAEVMVEKVEGLTGFPEILGGRVKTLHPKILGGILANPKDPAHARDMERHDIAPVHLVAVNLYPFEAMMESREEEELLREFIDIGGVTLLRASAKNYPHVIVITDPKDYNWIIEKLKAFGDLSLQERRILAYKAFEHTAYYDATIAAYFRRETPAVLGDEITLRLKKMEDLRYGENPHQRAAVYSLPQSHWGIIHAKVHQGKQLSFNNYMDLEAAWNAVKEFERPAAVIIKHCNPCGASTADTLAQAFRLAYESDPVSAYGGVIGLNREVDAETAEEISKIFFECVIAPEFHTQALARLSPKKNLRLLSMRLREVVPYNDLDFRAVSGGFLVQEKTGPAMPTELKVVTKREPTEQEWQALRFAWKVSRHVKSNAIVLAVDHQALGIGGGQTSRVDALRIAIAKIRDRKVLAKTSSPMVLASDGFLPFSDTVVEASEFGVSAIIQPGGSIRDEDSIKAANERGMAMVFTGVRQFLH